MAKITVVIDNIPEEALKDMWDIPETVYSDIVGKEVTVPDRLNVHFDYKDIMTNAKRMAYTMFADITTLAVAKEGKYLNNFKKDNDETIQSSGSN